MTNITTAEKLENLKTEHNKLLQIYKNQADNLIEQAKAYKDELSETHVYSVFLEGLKSPTSYKILDEQEAKAKIEREKAAKKGTITIRIGGNETPTKNLDTYVNNILHIKTKIDEFKESIQKLPVENPPIIKHHNNEILIGRVNRGAPLYAQTGGGEPNTVRMNTGGSHIKLLKTKVSKMDRDIEFSMDLGNPDGPYKIIEAAEVSLMSTKAFMHTAISEEFVGKPYKPPPVYYTTPRSIQSFVENVAGMTPFKQADRKFLKVYKEALEMLELPVTEKDYTETKLSFPKRRPNRSNEMDEPKGKIKKVKSTGYSIGETKTNVVKVPVLVGA